MCYTYFSQLSTCSWRFGIGWFDSLPVGCYLPTGTYGLSLAVYEFFSVLKHCFHSSDPDTMTITALKMRCRAEKMSISTWNLAQLAQNHMCKCDKVWQTWHILGAWVPYSHINNQNHFQKITQEMIFTELISSTRWKCNSFNREVLLGPPDQKFWNWFCQY